MITHKNNPRGRFRTSVVLRLAHEIKQINKNFNVLVVCGAGSYGHPLAKKYNLKFGMKTLEQKRGFSKVVYKVASLNALVVAQFEKANLCAISLPPHAFVTQEAGTFACFDFMLVKNYLEGGFIPILSGDMVIDSKWGCSILSGDTIISYLSKNLGAAKVVFLSDVDGVFTNDPKKDKKAVFIPKITSESFSTIKNLFTQESIRNDVTGEMIGKLKEIKREFSGTEVYIANGFRKNILSDLIYKSDVRATKITF